MNKRNSDVLVIGAGMSGLVAALAAARRGRKVTVLPGRGSAGHR